MSIIRNLIFTFFVGVFCTANVYAQDFSNKGKEFWVVFPPHQPSAPANLAAIPPNSSCNFVTAEVDSFTSEEVSDESMMDYLMNDNTSLDVIDPGNK